MISRDGDMSLGKSRKNEVTRCQEFSLEYTVQGRKQKDTI